MLLLSFLLCIAFLGFSSTLGAENDVYTFWDEQCDKYYKNAEQLTTEFPYMVFLGYEYDNGKIAWRAAGSLISNKHVLASGTATAHPFRKYTLKRIRIGATNFETSDKKDIQEIDVDSLIIHPSFRRGKSYYDIAIAVLKKNVEFNTNVRPVCFEKVDDLNEKELIGTSWSPDIFSFSLTNVLKNETYIFGTYDVCRNIIGNETRKVSEGILEEHHICAYTELDGGNICTSDTGGPLQLKHSKYDQAYNQIGITSFGKYCNNKYIPVVYTNVTHFLPWIKNIITE